MHAASREALAHTRAQLQSELGENPAGGATGAKLGQELFAVVDVLDNDRALRVAIADSAAPASAREELVRSVFGWKIDQPALNVLSTAVAQSWSTPRELREGLVDVARLALLVSAAAQGQLPTVEDELFRLGRIIADHPELEQALRDRRTGADAKRALLGQVLYGKVTAVTEALASQAVARPDRRPVEDIDALSHMAAELQGNSVANVTAASELSADQQEALKERLGTIYGRSMTSHINVDPDIMGGLVIRVGDEIIDGSVSGRLDSLRRSLP